MNHAINDFIIQSNVLIKTYLTFNKAQDVKQQKQKG